MRGSVCRKCIDPLAFRSVPGFGKEDRFNLIGVVIGVSVVRDSEGPLSFVSCCYGSICTHDSIASIDPQRFCDRGLVVTQWEFNPSSQEARSVNEKSQLDGLFHNIRGELIHSVNDSFEQTSRRTQ